MTRCSEQSRGVRCQYAARHRGKCNFPKPSKTIISKFHVGDLFDSKYGTGRFRIARIEFNSPTYFDDDGSPWMEDEMIRVKP